MKVRRYTEAEDAFVIANYLAMKAVAIATTLNRHEVSVRKRAKFLGVSRPLSRWTAQEDNVIRDGIGRRPLAEVSRELKRSPGAVVFRTRMLGLGRWRAPRCGRHSGRKIDGFNDGGPVYTHRAVVERQIGRQLTSDEIVHHIDFDKDNNGHDNLHLYPSRAEHRRAHMSFEDLVPGLLRMGVVTFNKATGRYELSEVSA